MPTICIFTASSDACPEKYKTWAREIAGGLAELGWDLVFGGSHMGLMTLVASEFNAAGRSVTSVIPHAFKDRCEVFPRSDEIIKVETLRQRKQMMADHADAFLALTGGCGTLDEFLEILTLKHLSMAPESLVLFNPEGYWTPFLEMLDKMDAEGFSPRRSRDFFVAAASPNEVIKTLQQARTQ